jgi:hypothetical protein
MVETASSEQKPTLVERIVEIISAIFHPLILPAIAFTFLVIAHPTDDLSHILHLL